MQDGERRITSDFMPGRVRGASVANRDANRVPPVPPPHEASPHAGSGARARYVGPYRLLALIGEGAMGRVFRAEHSTLGRQVALKVLRPELAVERNCVDRFFAEARAANQIRSEHLVAVTDLCREPSGDTYLVMELLEGMDLYDLQASSRVSVVRILRMMRQLCEVVAQVHEAGIVHRDLKPENIFVTLRDGQDFIKLLDFGIAKDSTADARMVRRTAPGILIGTPQYMSPEQATAGLVDHRADLYALGVILFQLLSDRLPFETTDLADLLSEIAYKRPPRVSDVVRLPESIATRMDALVMCCLRKEPSRRPQSALEIAAVIDELIADLLGCYEGSAETLSQLPGGHPVPTDLRTARPALSSLLDDKVASIRPYERRWLTRVALWTVAAGVTLASLWQLSTTSLGQRWTHGDSGESPTDDQVAATASVPGLKIATPTSTSGMHVVTEPLVPAETDSPTGTPKITSKDLRSRARQSELGGSDRRARVDARATAAQAESPSREKPPQAERRSAPSARRRLALPQRDVVLNPFLR